VKVFDRFQVAYNTVDKYTASAKQNPHKHMAPYISWIASELAKRFPKADLHKGIDLNGNGRLEEPEKIHDFDDDGVVGSERDLRDFLKKNELQIRSLGGFFKWSEPFKTNNPIHDILAIESELASPQEVKEAYHKLDKIFSHIRLVNPNLTPQDKLKRLHDIMESMGFTFGDSDHVLFVQDMAANRLDGDTASFVVLAIGHELGWPIYLVTAPRYMFVRWEGGDNAQFNIDFGTFQINQDQDYVRSLNIPAVSIQQGTYLRNLDRKRIFAFALSNRGVEKKIRGDYLGAIEDCNQSINLDPSNVQSYINRGGAKGQLGNHRGDIEDQTVAIQLNPNNSTAYINRGVAKKDLGNLRDAFAEYDKAIELDPGNAFAYTNRCLVKDMLGDDLGAINDCDQAIKINPKMAEAYDTRGSAKANMGKNKEALEDFNKAIELNPQLANAYNNRGLVKSALHDLPNAITDFDKSIQLNPNFVEAYMNRGITRGELGQPGRAIEDFNTAIRLDPKDFRPYYNRAVTRAGQGNLEGALFDLDKAFEINPNDSKIKTVQDDLKKRLKKH